MYNKIVLVGRLGRDAEARGKDGKVVALNVATTNSYKDNKGEWIEETEWTQCVVFGKFGEYVLGHAKKGDLVLVEGRKKSDEYVKDDVKKTSTYVVVETYKRLSWQSDNQKSKPEAQQDNGERPWFE